MTDLYLPAEARREILRGYGHVHELGTFIETGTSDGGTTWALREEFQFIHTIEVDPYLYKQACDRFAPFLNITCWHGDSGKLLPEILELVYGPALVWLDGHWCAPGHNPDGPDTPVREELTVLLADGRPHVILIDDARVFREGADWETEQYDYPTITWVRETAERHGFDFELKDDVMRLVPQ
jgi:hypothetical protein